MNTQQIAPEHLAQLIGVSTSSNGFNPRQERIQGEMVTIAQQWQREEAETPFTPRATLRHHWPIHARC